MQNSNYYQKFHTVPYTKYGTAGMKQGSSVNGELGTSTTHDIIAQLVNV